jgi:hypothetical protein
MQKCSGCARCRYVSFSREWSDCSWYAACDVTRLEQEMPGFATLNFGSPFTPASLTRLDWTPFRTRDRVAQLSSSKQDNHDSNLACKAPLFSWVNASGLLARSGDDGRQGRLKWLDVGGGRGSLGRELGKRRLVGGAASRKVAYDCVDVVKTAACPRFDGGTLPQATGSRDVVSFLFVLHHASGRTVSLLEHAKRVSRGHIVVLEDLQGETQRQAKQQFAHEWQGQFRADDEWRALFRLLGLRLVHHTPVPHTCSWGYHVPRAMYVLAV